ncbi:uncharacterized protein METZ01_LOCUS8495 [marine metagenome]|uniref:Uncharacterized protein n=1 Tax=marine metagenome TaxID=408172 RepID=A0A381NM23_9ZZZZ
MAKKYDSVLAIQGLDFEIPKGELYLVFLVETVQKKPL